VPLYIFTPEEKHQSVINDAISALEDANKLNQTTYSAQVVWPNTPYQAFRWGQHVYLPVAKPNNEAPISVGTTKTDQLVSLYLRCPVESDSAEQESYTLYVDKANRSGAVATDHDISDELSRTQSYHQLTGHNMPTVGFYSDYHSENKATGHIMTPYHGMPLADWMGTNALPLQTRLTIANQLLSQLTTLFTRGEPHRDINPTNLTWDSKNLSLIDLDPTNDGTRGYGHNIMSSPHQNSDNYGYVLSLCGAFATLFFSLPSQGDPVDTPGLLYDALIPNLQDKKQYEGTAKLQLKALIQTTLNNPSAGLEGLQKMVKDLPTDGLTEAKSTGVPETIAVTPLAIPQGAQIRITALEPMSQPSEIDINPWKSISIPPQLSNPLIVTLFGLSATGGLALYFKPIIAEYIRSSWLHGEHAIHVALANSLTAFAGIEIITLSLAFFFRHWQAHSKGAKTPCVQRVMDVAACTLFSLGMACCLHGHDLVSSHLIWGISALAIGCVMEALSACSDYAGGKDGFSNDLEEPLLV
jgi:hypothetical protein